MKPQTPDPKENNPSAKSARRTTYQLARVLPLEEYIARFNRRYEGEGAFRDIVHSYFKLSGLTKFTLGVSRYIYPSHHKAKTQSMIHDYALQIRTQLENAARVQGQITGLQAVHQEASEKARVVEESQQAYEGFEHRRYHTLQEKEQRVSALQSELEQKVTDTKTATENRKEEIIRTTDAHAIVVDRLKARLTKSAVIKVNPTGEVVFDDRRIVTKLEDKFLDEIITEIDKEGHSGFLYRLRRTYEDLVSHVDVVETLAELPHVDWVGSAIYARMQGYRLPAYPHLVATKFEGGAARKSYISNVDSAIALDCSGSMTNNQRFDIAQKTSLALHSLMRRIDPKHPEKNHTSLCCYQKGIAQQRTTIELMKEVHPDGGTPTHLALDWLIQTLSHSPAGIAYLVTDGDPDNTEECIRAASKFKDYPQLLLRIFLIDSNAGTIDNTRRIGKAAGPKTRVFPISNYQLSGGLIKDVADAIGDIKTIDEL